MIQWWEGDRTEKDGALIAIEGVLRRLLARRYRNATRSELNRVMGRRIVAGSPLYSCQYKTAA